MEKGTEYQYVLSPNPILMISKWSYKKRKREIHILKTTKIPNKKRDF